MSHAARGARDGRRERGAGGGRARTPLPLSPTSGEVFYGPVVARAPAGAGTATLIVDGAQVASTRVRGGRARFVLHNRVGRHNIAVRFFAGGRVRGGVSARGVWRLPVSALRSTPGAIPDDSWSSSLARALRGGPRYRAAWVQDLRSGAYAGVNAGARYPAASTVKLGLLVGALARIGGAPERSPFFYDLKAMTTWSSNFASNRLLRRLGGNAVAKDGLRRLGARSSTFTGEYIVGTELQPGLPSAGASSAPPSVSSRVTTAQDLGRMLFAIHASASGRPRSARRETGLTGHQARLALGWLLSSQQRGDNVSLLAGGVRRGTPIGQKNGWIRAARLGAGIIYTATGPRIAVVMGYDANGVSLAGGQSLGARVASVAAS